MSEKKLKIVWVCNVMNDIVRDHLHANISIGRRMLIGLFKIVSPFITCGTRKRLFDYLYYLPQNDYGQWNTNAIKEFERIRSVDLHVIIPVSATSYPLEVFEIKGIHYYILQNKESLLYKALGNKVSIPTYKHNRRVIKSIIDKISPDLVHIIGAENPQYSQVVFDIYNRLPVIVQLQTLLSDPQNSKFVKSFNKLAEMEKKILSLPVYIGITMPVFKKIIESQINPKAKFLNIALAVNEPVVRKNYPQKYDFVYFSANISKAADLAVSAFCLAAKQYPKMTLDIIGSYSPEFKEQLDSKLIENGLEHNVIFEGSLPTHTDVISKIRESRFALLPLRIDMISGTIREACANGLPVVTTITGGTPQLNQERPTVLLSKIGDASSMAENMIRLIEDPELAKTLKENGYIYAEGLMNNREAMQKWVEAYYELCENN